MRKLHTTAAALLVAALTAGCSGNGDGGDAAPPPAGDADRSSITLAGTVAKGALRNAVVKAHPIAADGRVDTATTLAETLSDAAGRYTLGFEGRARQPYVVRATPRPAGAAPATTQLDEIAGETPVAPDFAVRALFVPAAAGAASAAAHVTPFSDLAVAAAEKGSGGVSAANAAQATANVAALLGFDPTTVEPTTIAAASAGGGQALALATLLTAVSKLANDGGLGCAQPALAERTACVTDALARSATLASTKPGTVGGVDVSAALLGAVQAVVASNDLSPTVVAVVAENLQGAGTPPPVDLPSDVAGAIAAAKTLFTAMRSDWQALFGGGAASAAGAEARKFSDAMRAVQAPADVLLKDAGAVLMGIDLYRDYLAGRTTVNNRGRAAATDWVAGGGDGNAGANRTTVGCTLYTDSTNTVPAQSPAQVQSIGCQALYFIARRGIAGGSEITLWRHGFTILPGETADSFNYMTRARRSVDTCTPGCVRTANEALQTSAYAGTIAVVASADSRHVVGFTIQGELPGAFEQGGTALVNERHSWSLTGTRTPGAVSDEDASTVTGTIASFAAGGTEPMGTLKVTEAKLGSVAMSRTAGGAIVRRGHADAVSDAGGEAATGDLPIEWTTASAAFAGRLELADTAWDASGRAHVPARVALSGTFRNLAGGTTTEFLEGTITATTTRWAQYDSTQPDSATNRFDVGLQFAGRIAVPGRPTVALTLAAGGVSGQEEPTSLTAQYRSLVGDNATQTVNLVLARPVGAAASLTFSEASSNLSLQYARDAATATLRRGTAGNGTEVGTLDVGSGLLTFVDHSTMSLDFGL